MLYTKKTTRKLLQSAIYWTLANVFMMKQALTGVLFSEKKAT